MPSYKGCYKRCLAFVALQSLCSVCRFASYKGCYKPSTNDASFPNKYQLIEATPHQSSFDTHTQCVFVCGRVWGGQREVDQPQDPEREAGRERERPVRRGPSTTPTRPDVKTTSLNAFTIDPRCTSPKLPPAIDADAVHDTCACRAYRHAISHSVS